LETTDRFYFSLGSRCGYDHIGLDLLIFGFGRSDNRAGIQKLLVNLSGLVSTIVTDCIVVSGNPDDFSF
jgi:hypothetical protein